ncbi:hypothetical protein SAMD00019534_035650 [Acytostelium subglobosum LB1]|uniref:hypothetical protein n=1 Tax=Acytostelium subglobosum LB1 TaxID=1410327 RepID=UPI000644C864|nr:hypothetical protein SAMD00019534_035650 [Acytostelium subglobosum LB1]GAM20390.1 hypothetical protein SAMD00019534_035650 [Acytostelium subglobosum LB1]|eukprot:XP_012759911.1 hypothetical protein SAMD00019534_035650 [Acytostelium subglobosum LB1]
MAPSSPTKLPSNPLNHLRPVDDEDFVEIYDDSYSSDDEDNRRSKERRIREKAPKSEHEILDLEKKPRLPSSIEIYNRIKWDCTDVDIDEFSIIYEDRILGLVEVIFSKYEIGTIPLHRVKTFKYQNNIIWDRKTRFIAFPEL